MIDSKVVRAIASALDDSANATWTKNSEGRVVIRTGSLDWEIYPVEDPPGVQATFEGALYQVAPEIYISGGAGLRSRWFAAVDGRVLDLAKQEDMKWFLTHCASTENPDGLAELLDACQGEGRMANVYRADGRLERNIGEKSRSKAVELGLEAPVVNDGELTFYTWGYVMDDREEVIELKRWSLRMDAPNGPEWTSTRLPGFLRYGD